MKHGWVLKDKASGMYIRSYVVETSSLEYAFVYPTRQRARYAKHVLETVLKVSLDLSGYPIEIIGRG